MDRSPSAQQTKEPGAQSFVQKLQTEVVQDDIPEVGEMKRGDYLIHVFIEQARQLKCPEGTVDPLIEVTVLNEKKFTTTKESIGPASTVSWNEHLFFEPKNLSVEQIEQAKIRVKVLDKGYFKNAVIGCYDFDVAYIYFMQKHSLMHKWLALSNPASPHFSEVAGYLKLSISVTAAGDEQIAITEDTCGESGEESILMPPSIKPEFYQITFKFFRAEQLPAMDISLVGGPGKIDAFISCQYLSTQLKTSVVTAQFMQPVDWNEEFLIPCQMPMMSSRIVMKLYDSDPTRDEIVGSMLFNMKECIDQKNGLFFWQNIYGAPIGRMGHNTDQMNSNPDIASTWKGRVLMQVTAEKTDKPVCKKQKLQQEDIDKAKEYMEIHEYEMIAEVDDAISLPTAEKYSVMIKVADYTFNTGLPVRQEGVYNRWKKRFDQSTWYSPYKNINDIGRVYVYLMHNDKPVCYFKDDIQNYTRPDPEWKWIQMVPDLSIGKVTEYHKAGLVRFKMSIYDKTKIGPIEFKDFLAWNMKQEKRLNVMKVRVYIFQCRDLPAGDADGSSDPYIRIFENSKDMKKTRVINDNNNPQYYETLELNIECTSIQNMPPFILDVFDKDTISDDFLGRCVIPIRDASYSVNDEIPLPKWHDIHLQPNTPACGQILVSFSIVNLEYRWQHGLNYVNISEHVDLQECMVDINILGLRDLQSVGILPVKKAFIQFNLKSLVPPQDGRALENIRTQPNSAGANPTINTLIQFRVPLPKSDLFCPRLACTVHDYIFKGISQPQIGSFTIPIGNLLIDLVKERDEETNKIEYIIEEIEKIMVGEGITTNFDPQNEVDTTRGTFDEQAQKKQVTDMKKLRSSVKIAADEELKQPLLLNSFQDDDEDSERRLNSSFSSPYKRIRQSSARQSSAERRPTLNPMKVKSVDKFRSGQKTLMIVEKMKQMKQERLAQEQRERDMEAFKQSGAKVEAVSNVIMAKYDLDKRLNVYKECKIPPESLYIGLGYDESPESKVKHYRRYFSQELEHVKEIMPSPSPFQTYEIKRGQTRGNTGGWWPFSSKMQKFDDSGALSDEHVVGKFKGIVAVQTEEDKKAYKERKSQLVHNLKHKLNQLSLKKTCKKLEFKLDQMDTFEGRKRFELDMETLGVGHLEISKHLANLESDETLNRLLMGQKKCIVRVYVIQANNLASRDNNSDSDPYLIVSLGNKVFNERDKHFEDEPNPGFYTHYDFEAVFPGCPPLTIQVMDYDHVFGDDLIGKTSIDLEDRFFSPEWQSIEYKPIEVRSLYHPSQTLAQGSIKVWVEIFLADQEMSEIPVYDISPKPTEEFEVRLAVFDTEDVIAMDVEGTSDVFCRAFFDTKEAKETDTHYRCQTGNAEFNWRLLFSVQHPRPNYIFTIQLFDRDFFKANDMIGEVQLDLKPLIEDVSLSQRPMGLTQRYYNEYLKEVYKKTKCQAEIEFKDDNSFWLVVKGVVEGEKFGEFRKTGQVRVQLDVFPKNLAENNKVGEARQEPNHSPFLPPPIGRLSFSINPFKMMEQLVSASVRRKLYCMCCIAICCALMIVFFPYIALFLTNMTSNMF